MAHSYRARVTGHQHDRGVHLVSLEVSWTHGIYGTRESETYHAFVDGSGDARLLNRHGERLPFGPFDEHPDPDARPFVQAVSRAVREALGR